MGKIKFLSKMSYKDKLKGFDRYFWFQIWFGEFN